MKSELIYMIWLIRDLVEYNKHSEKNINLKEYMIKELNYLEQDAIIVNNNYNKMMKYS